MISLLISKNVKVANFALKLVLKEVLERSRQVNNKGYLYIVKVQDNCTGCTNCALVCPEGGITVYRKTVDGKKQVAKIDNVTEDMNIEVNE